MVGRLPGVARLRLFEHQINQVQFLDKRIDRSGRIVLANALVLRLRQQRNLESRWLPSTYCFLRRSG